MSDPLSIGVGSLNANNATHTRRQNRRAILHALRLQGGMSRAELSRVTGLTPPAIANIVQDLLDSGLVRDAGRRKSARGQPPIAIEIARDGGYAVGLRVESRHYDFVVADLGGELIETGKGDVPQGSDQNLISFLADLYSGFANHYGPERSFGLGLVTPGPFDAIWPGVPTPGAIPSLQTRSLVRALAGQIGTDVFLENDATAAALGEKLYGAAKSLSNFFYVFVGEGIGGGIVIRGEPYRGDSGNAGEFGHLIVDPNGPLCYCGNRGCLGEYLSLSSLERRRLDHPGMDGAIVEAEWLQGAAKALSTALVGVENLFDPQAVILGGTAPNSLIVRLIDAMGEMRPSVRLGLGVERLRLSEIGEQSAALGASALPILAATSTG